MAFLNGTLQLLEPSEPRGRRLPIDFFFRSLAQDQHQLAIGIVLSGTGSDGTLGVRAIKGEAGMVMAQSPEFHRVRRHAAQRHRHRPGRLVNCRRRRCLRS
jgi:two-component system CheB/CheR fusion protein